MAEEKALVKVDERLEEYTKKGFNILLPTTTIQEISPLHKATLEIVKISVDPRDKEIYEPRTGSGDWALNGNALEKIAYAAGISWVPEDCRRTDDGTNPNIVSYRAVGKVKKEDGEFRVQVGEYTIDLSVIEEEIREQYTKKAGREKNWSEQKKKDYVETCLRRDMLQKRKFRFQLAQSGAMYRVIRKILALKGTYKKDVLQKPFVVPKIAFHPDINDPEVRKVLLKQGATAARQLFGSGEGIAGELPLESDESPEEQGQEEAIDVEAEKVESEGADEVGQEEADALMRTEFINQETDDKVKTLTQMMARKGYDPKNLKKGLKEFKEEQKVAFYDHLVAMEDKEEIPF